MTPIRTYKDLVAFAFAALAAVLWWYIAERTEFTFQVRWLSEAIVAEKIERDSGTVILSWDAPAELSHYRIYYRQRGSTEWRHHGDSEPSTNPRYAMELDDGEWEFAIRWVDVHGRESELHTSLDDTAQIDDARKGGWFLDLRAAPQ